MCAPKTIFTVLFLAVSLRDGFSKTTDKQYSAMPQLFEYDDYTRCMTHGDEALFCRITFQLHPENPENPSEVWNVIQEVNSKGDNYRHDLLRHGVCATETCRNGSSPVSKNGEDVRDVLNRCYNQRYHHMGLKGEIVEIQCETNESPYQYDTYDMTFLYIVIGYAAFVLLASFYEGFARYLTEEGYHKMMGTPVGSFLSNFAITKNWIRLKTVNLESEDVRNLRFIQGVRVYSTLLVIIMHTLMVNASLPVSNMQWPETMTEKFISLFFCNGGFAVQTFFVISAFLLTFQFMNFQEGKNEITVRNIMFFVVSRYVRLTPPLALVVLFNSTWMIHLARGPFWDVVVGDEYRNCRQNGWSNMLYLNNFVDGTNMCMPHSWYMAVDTQFFVYILLVLWYLWYHPKNLPMVVGAWLAAHVAFLAGTIYWNNYESLVRPKPEIAYGITVFKEPTWIDLLVSPLANMPGPIVGMVLGIVYYKYKSYQFPLFNNRLYSICWYTLIWVFGLGIAIGPPVVMFHPEYKHSQLFATVYGSTSRLVYSVTMGVFFWSMSKGTGWMNNYSLEWAPTYVLGRLTYSAYLVHFTIAKILAGLKPVPHFLIDFSILCDAIAIAFLSYLSALLLALFVELPITELQKSARHKGHKAKVEHGTTQNGTVHNATTYNVTIRYGATQNGTTQYGTTQNGTTHNGTSHNGTAHNGTSHNGTTHNGTAHNGTTHNGTAHNGTTHNGTSHAQNGPSKLIKGE